MDTIKSMTTGTSGGGDIASAFTNFIWNNYISSAGFWGIIILVFLFLWIGRVFLFDNKNIKWLDARGWVYPLYFFVIIIFCVWLKNENPFGGKKYISDLLTTAGVIAVCYVAFGHKLVAWLSKISGERLGLTAGYSKSETTLIQSAGGDKITTEITQTKEKEEPKP